MVMLSDMDACRRPKNTAEAMAWDAMVEGGMVPQRRGYPDFWTMVDGQLVMVEVKPSPTVSLKLHQLAFMDIVGGLGVECFRFDPYDGLVRLPASDRPTSLCSHETS